MRKYTLFLIGMVPFCAFSQTSIQGKIGTLPNPNARIYLQYSVQNETKIDSTVFQNGSFIFKNIPISNASKTILIVSPEGQNLQAFSNDRMKNNKKALPPDFIDLFVDKGENVTITSADSLKKAQISGSKLNVAYQNYQNQLKPILEQLKDLTAQVRAVKSEQRNNSHIMQPLEDKRQALVSLLANKNLEFANSNPNDYFSLVALTEYLRAKPTKALDIAGTFAKLSAYIKQQPLARVLENTIKGSENSAAGNIIPNFQQNDFLNKPVSITDFRGKYTLVYFWASWCSSCRETNAEINEVYRLYNDKGFEVLGVSLDKEKAEWTKAIRTDGLLFANVSDLNGWENSVAAQLGVKRIPDNILIDTNGKIVARNLTATEVKETLNRVLRPSDD